MVQRPFEPDGFVEPVVLQFVEHHVTSLLAWDVIMFFASNPEAVLDDSTLSFVLRRHPCEIRAEVEALCDARILTPCAGGVRYAPEPPLCEQVAQFADACRDHDQRLTLVAYVLQRTCA